MEKNMSTSLKTVKTLLLLLILSGCSLNPGMNKPTMNLELNENVELIDITTEIISEQESALENYLVSSGDILSIVVFGQQEYFPIANIGANNPYTSRMVDQEGEIFFPYVGNLKVAGQTISEVRNQITLKLSKTFNDPQVDVSIYEFNSKRNVYVLGEVKDPTTLSVGLVSLTLADAIASAEGLAPGTSNANQIYVIRGSKELNKGKIYRASLRNSSKLVISGQFKLLPGDIVFVGAADITLWNRFITQLFPFASFLNQVDNIEN